MDRQTAITAIFEIFAAVADRYAAHAALRPLLQRLSRDRQFLRDAVRAALLKGHLQKATVLTVPIAENGDVNIDINLFAPIRNGSAEVAADYIHHHGWRLLSSSVIRGGYDAIMFQKNSHNERAGEGVALRIAEEYRHAGADVRFVDSNTCHVVFRPQSLAATLAVWSGDKRRASQVVKQALSRAPALRRLASRTAHAIRLSRLLGLSPASGFYFRPVNGRIEAVEHDREFDIDRLELVACTLRFLEIIEFEDKPLLTRLKAGFPPDAKLLVDQFNDGDPIVETGVAGHPKRYFTKYDVLGALASI